MEESEERRRWTLLTSHGHVLVEIARDPRARVRDISAIIGITERATQAIIADLVRAGYVERVRVGRRTHYVVHMDNPFRHSAQDGLRVGPFLEMLAGTAALTGSPTPEEALAAEDFAAAPLPPPEIPELPALSEIPEMPGIPELPGSPTGGEYPKN